MYQEEDGAKEKKEERRRKGRKERKEGKREGKLCPDLSCLVLSWRLIEVGSRLRERNWGSEFDSESECSVRTMLGVLESTCGLRCDDSCLRLSYSMHTLNVSLLCAVCTRQLALTNYISRG